MTFENRRDAIALELQRSGEAMEMADFGIQRGLWAEAEGRLYYALYHAAVALLLTEGVEPRSHTGVGSLLGQHFVRSGLLTPDEGRLVARMRQYRMLARYSRDFVLDRATVSTDHRDCVAFIARVRGLIEARGLDQ